MLIHEPHKVRVQTPHGEVAVSSHAAALISVDPEVTHVIDLFDWRLGCVKVNIGNSSKAIAPGDEVSVVNADDQNSAQAIVLSDGLRRRHLKCVALGEKHFFVIDECSLVDGILKLPLLDRLHHSTNKQEHRMFEAIVKTAASLSIAGSSDPYSVHN